jgi:hypothetical protein
LGIDVGDAAGDQSAVILSLSERGILSGWNKNHPTMELAAGNIIVQANGVRGYWAILEELGKAGRLELKVERTPPTLNWQEEIYRLSESLRCRGMTSSLRLRVPPQGGRPVPRGPREDDSFVTLPTVRAGDVDMAQCCICMADCEADTMLVQLPCKHCFHRVCAARWLTQSKRCACPLCNQSLVGAS